MKKLPMFAIFMIILLEVSRVMAGVIVLEGNYQGKNLFVQNPFGASGVGFCVMEVLVNDQVTTDEINSSAFEIDFKNFQLKLGDKIEVKIKHKDDCKPKVLNPEVLRPRSTYDVLQMKVEKDGTLKWSTKGETGKLPYIVEQFVYTTWKKVGEVEGIGSIEQNDYSFKIVPHSGKNQFRVKQVDYTNQPHLSRPVDYQSPSAPLDFLPKKVNNIIEFVQLANNKISEETMFEIYDQYGNIVKKGFAKQVDVSNLQKGVYYIIYDGKSGEFVKK
jgi:hypothetical protein